MAHNLFRFLLERGGGDGGSSDEDEEVALLEHEDTTSESQDSEREDEPNNMPEGDGQQRAVRENKFDISLPARHLYLGELEEESRAVMADEQTIPTLPLLCISGQVLFPGETLPMRLYNPHLIQKLRDASTSNKPVAICTDLRHTAQELQRPTQKELSEIGTTVEVIGSKEEDNSEFYYGPCFVVKLLGRQRFRLLEVFRRTNGLMDGRVEILPEQVLPPRPLDVFSCPAHIHNSYLATLMASSHPDSTIQSQIQLEVCRKRLQKPILSSSLCQVPSWVFTLYDTEYLRELLVREQNMMTFVPEEGTIASLSHDVTGLSYWLARRLPIDDTSKLQLLSIHCPTQRLIRGLQILKEFTELCCTHCDAPIAKKEHIFSMSVDGPLASYVNPGGHVHDTLTVSEATNLRRQGSASTEHSWFPGYKWTILTCKRCHHHKGWCFEATTKKLRPAKFFGLTRASLNLKTSAENEKKQ